VAVYIGEPLVWSQPTTDKLAVKHNLTPEEAEEVVFEDAPRYKSGRGKTLQVFGQAVSGRYILVVLAKAGRGGRYRVVTARDMSGWEREYYERARGR
jgi:uncharacterized DUF497 family protein